MKLTVLILFLVAFDSLALVKSPSDEIFYKNELNDDSLKTIIADTTIIHPGCFIVMAIGDTFPAIYFYDTLGKKIHSKSLFKNNMPVIFINGSYTCHIFRGNVKRINKFVKKNSVEYDIYFVYVQEAHPASCSPYGEMNENIPANKKKGIIVEQPVYYKDRVYYAKKTVKDLQISLPLLIDNEYNDFYTSVFGGPNGYLVFSKDRKLIEQRRWYFNRQYNRRKFWHNLTHRKKRNKK